jgi:hypothetical protein
LLIQALKGSAKAAKRTFAAQDNTRLLNGTHVRRCEYFIDKIDHPPIGLMGRETLSSISSRNRLSSADRPKYFEINGISSVVRFKKYRCIRSASAIAVSSASIAMGLPFGSVLI